jgi:hypothetical protein
MHRAGAARRYAAAELLDPLVILNPKALSVILVLFVLDFYGSVAKFIGLTLNTSIMENGRLPRRTRAAGDSHRGCDRGRAGPVLQPAHHHRVVPADILA